MALGGTRPAGLKVLEFNTVKAAPHETKRERPHLKEEMWPF
jgi:hypothetical protein